MWRTSRQRQVAEVRPHLIPGYLPVFCVTHRSCSHGHGADNFPISIARRKVRATARVVPTILGLQSPCIVGAGLAPALLDWITGSRYRNSRHALGGSVCVAMWMTVIRCLGVNDDVGFPPVQLGDLTTNDGNLTGG